MNTKNFTGWGLALLLAVLTTAGCATNRAPELTPLEIQSIQSREFEAPMDIVFPSVISVFQDLGYTIVSADKGTGFLTAESATTSNAATKFWLGITQTKQIRATAFVEPTAMGSRVRLNFVGTNEVSGVYGQRDREDVPIYDAQVYQNAFEKIDTAIFVRSAN